MRLYWLNIFDKGNIAMSARPKGESWLEEEIQILANHNIHLVIFLLEKSEETELVLNKEKEFCKKQGIHFISFPIKDRQVPESKKQFLDLLKEIDSYLQTNQNILIHCRMGIGRTGLVCAGILLHQKLIKSSEVFEFLSKQRTLQVPDTQIQKDWILEYLK